MRTCALRTSTISRDIALNQVFARPEIVLEARECSVEAEPLESLVRTVVETARYLGVDYLDTALLPMVAISVARREWERTERLKRRH